MPEVITKHPEIAKEVLRSAGAKCGTGEPQKILTKCPRAQFCALPGGEICVYGVSDIGSMTQLSRSELCGARTEADPPAPPPAAIGAAGWGLAALVPAVVAAAVVTRSRARARR
jgi:hypothetical protein